MFQRHQLTTSYWTVWGLFVFALFIRLFNLTENLHFTGDEGRDALVVLELLRGQAFPLLGPTSSVGNLSLGPLFYYFMAPWLWLFQLDPIGPAIMVVIFSAATASLLFYVGKLIFRSSIVGMMAALIFSVSPVAVEYGRWSWNPNLMPFFSLLLFLALFQVFQLKKERWLLIVALSLGVIVQLHYLGLASLVLVLVVAIWHRQRSIGLLKNWRLTTTSTAILGLLISPLLVYDLMRNFKNLRGMAEVTTANSGAGVLYPLRVAEFYQTALTDFLALPTAPIAYLIAGGLLLVLVLNRKQIPAQWLALWLATSLLVLGVYSGPVMIHYLEILWPCLALIVAVAIKQLWKANRYLGGVTSLLLLGFLTLKAMIFLTTPTLYTPHILQIISSLVKNEAAGQPFNLAVLSSMNSDKSYQYFLTRDLIPAEQKVATAQLFVICEGNHDCNYHGHPDWNIAVFEARYQGQTEIDQEWGLYNHFQVLRIIPKL